MWVSARCAVEQSELSVCIKVPPQPPVHPASQPGTRGAAPTCGPLRRMSGTEDSVSTLLMVVGLQRFVG